ncbi:sulfurtransferase complex subunit TusB [Microbulbifer aggregans]|uniref:sulfurtransferase complex subunit TusB n=1 Tax=Microbulbifer aggregans TaxID=1769779 RepID=UPI001CFD83C1|nr:sulfurtransferase complex subunit TusB [Microbulbifer aggregans]
MTLHIVSKSPYSSSALTDCASSCAEGDAIVLIEDAVYGAVETYPEITERAPVYCLQSDAEARGIVIGKNVEGIDETRWVTLCTEHNPIVSWFK